MAGDVQLVPVQGRAATPTGRPATSRPPCSRAGSDRLSGRQLPAGPHRHAGGSRDRRAQAARLHDRATSPAPTRNAQLAPVRSRWASTRKRHRLAGLGHDAPQHDVPVLAQPAQRRDQGRTGLRADARLHPERAAMRSTTSVSISEYLRWSGPYIVVQNGHVHHRFDRAERPCTATATPPPRTPCSGTTWSTTPAPTVWAYARTP